MLLEEDEVLKSQIRLNTAKKKDSLAYDYINKYVGKSKEFLYSNMNNFIVDSIIAYGELLSDKKARDLELLKSAVKDAIKEVFEDLNINSSEIGSVINVQKGDQTKASEEEEPVLDDSILDFMDGIE